jgi:hypothetical protein
MSEDVRLLARRGNIAVMQLPDRRYPGVMMQGDTFFILKRDVERLLQLLTESHSKERREEIEEMHETLDRIMGFYEEVCERNGIQLPY